MRKFLVLSYFLICTNVIYAHNRDFVKSNGQEPARIDSGIEQVRAYTLILTECKDFSEVAATRDYIIKQGGSVAIIGSKNVMLGWIDPSTASLMIGQYSITAIYYKPIDLSILTTSDRQTLQTVTFFNSVTSGTLEKQMLNEKSKQVNKIDYSDCFPHPDISYDNYLKNLEQNNLSIQSLKKKNQLLRLKADGTLLTGNSDVMVGTVAVAVFMIESDGMADPNLYSWSSEDEDSMYQRTLRDLTWWSRMAANYGKDLSFNIIPHYHSDPVCQQPYEPILHSSGDDNLWIGSIMNKLGFIADSHYTKVEAYNTWLRSEYYTDWAYSIFFAYNPSPAPSSFSNGYGGYAFLGGPYIQLLFTWFSSRVVSHETGHIFWAPDEYNAPGYGGCNGGANNTYSGIPNGNCELANVNSVDCMMKKNDYELCSFTPAHIGWTAEVPLSSLETSPQGLNITVNGVQRISPQAFPWGIGSKVNISVVTPQILNGKTYDFLSWSDGGAQSHSITIPDTATSYIANFSLAGPTSQTWLLYQQSNALPSTEISVVTIDEQDNVWVGTKGGLSKFDGKNWTTYNTANSGIPSNIVTSIALDSQGNKWIGIAPVLHRSTNVGGGFAKFDGTNWTVYDTSNSGLPSNNVESIAIDGFGNKWIGTDAGLAEFDGTNWTAYNRSNSGLPENNVRLIAIDGSGNKWIGTDAGLAEFDGTNWIVYNTLNSGLPDNMIMSITIDGSGNKWIGTSIGGLAKFNGTDWTVYNVSNSGISYNMISSIAIDGSGNKWIGIYHGGLVKFDDSNWIVYYHSNQRLPYNNVRSIAIDGSGNKWIGTANNGIAKFDDKNWIDYTFSNLGLPENRVPSIAIDGSGNKWIGTGGGLAKFDGSNWTVFTTSNSGLPNYYVSSIQIDNSGNKWIGTWGGGLAKFDNTDWIVYNTSNSGLPDNMIMSITIDGSGNKWIGTLSGGLVKFNGTNWIVYNSSNSGLPDNDVRAISIDILGNKWIGTWGGLANFDGANWTVYNTSNSGLPDKYINSIAIDFSRNKWIGTGNGGFAKFDGINWTVYNASNSGLPSNNVESIAIDNYGNKWIGTSGLAKFDGTNWTVYKSSNSGLPVNFVMSLAIDSLSNKWIGTYGGGLAVFNERGIDSLKEIPDKNEEDVLLFQNFPNPFNSSTNILFNLPAKSFVSLKIFDLSGKERAAIVFEELPAGIHSRQLNAASLSSGIYLYKLQTDSFTQTKKLIILK